VVVLREVERALALAVEAGVLETVVDQAVAVAGVVDQAVAVAGAVDQAVAVAVVDQAVAGVVDQAVALAGVVDQAGAARIECRLLSREKRSLRSLAGSRARVIPCTSTLMHQRSSRSLKNASE
jgi:hypothetical protein